MGQQKFFFELESVADNRISIALLSSFVVLTIQFFILVNFGLFETTMGAYLQTSSKLFVGLLYLYAFPFVFKRSKKKFLFTTLFAVFIFILHFACFPANRKIIKEIAFPFFTMCLPTFLYALSLRDFKVFKRIIQRAALIIWSFGMLTAGSIFLGWGEVGQYSMAFSYYMLIPLVVFIEDIWNQISLQSLVIIFLALLVIIMFGARGPLLCTFTFVCLMLVRPAIKLKTKTILAYGSLVLFVPLLILNFQNFLRNAISVLELLNIQSRTLRLFTQNSIHMSGREELYQQVWQATLNSPMKGIGLAGDRLIIGGYVHNLFLEILANFGLLLGGGVIFFLLVLICKALIGKDKLKYNITAIWFAIGLVGLLVSNSYLIAPKFWLFVGLLFKTASNKSRFKLLC